ncbi:sensor histidine kinase [Paenibacillus barcinonensis]|uniref:histidine kinase n=1 Tax=Paenibacillus barcinonensis TaxID=198119 RepID=A0A2V4WPW9_PAEBA|nr:sensor histidine kinase [Paenibacillus barcinonensis]PYE50073.1 two-component system sensor histidine kinase YesM [Paenibacillus barcinonensis]QKS59814.1 sensor histidine kinase [Paenibacillus barcinonensis]
MKLVQWITSSLRLKLLSMFIILSSVPLIVVGLISYHKSYTVVSDHNKAATQLAADQLARNIDIMFEDTERLLELGKNPQVLQYLYSQSESYAEAKAILQTYNLYRETYKYDKVLNISFVNFYGKGLSERKGVFKLERNPLRNPYFQYLVQYPNAILRIPHAAPYAEQNQLDGFVYPKQNALSIMTTVKERITQEVIGFIVIDMNDSFIDDFLTTTKIKDSGFFYINDQYGQTLFQPPTEQASPAVIEQLNALSSHAQQDSLNPTTGAKPQFVVYSTSKQTGWRIVGAAPFQEILAEANSIRQLIIISVLLSAFFAISLYFFLNNRLIFPIQILMNKMRKAASGYLEAKVSPAGSDEIADLGQSFNTMLEQIKALMEQNIKENEQVKIAELRTLQAQINPHFLYNTLESIIWMAEADKKESVIKLVQALSKFFRLSLNNGFDWVTIQTELEHARNYLVIQQMRYHDILAYEIKVDPELQHYPILKMTLQPLIENAIYHGIKNKRGQGHILIQACADETSIVLTVQDNGIGMSEEQLDQLREALEQSSDFHSPPKQEQEGGFGLMNVHHRIRLYFGPSYGVEMESTYMEGSTFKIRIPKSKEARH